MTTNNLTIPFSAVDEGDRKRKDYGDLSGLKGSLQRVGSIHPIVLAREWIIAHDMDTTGEDHYEYTIVAGGRRYRALKELGVTELHHASVLEPGKFGFLFKDEVPEDELREAELDENLYRLKPKWHEDVEMVADIHGLKRSKHGTKAWGLEQTAELLGEGYGMANVSYILRVSKLLRAGDEAIRGCKNLTEAISLLVKRKEDEAIAEVQRRAASMTQPLGGIGTLGGVSPTSFLDTLSGNNIITMPRNGEPGNPFATLEEFNRTIEQEKQNPTVVPPTPSGEPAPPAVVPLSQMFFLGDFRDVVTSWPDACMDHIVSDIPYGIDMENLDAGLVADVAAEHDVASNIDLFRPFLEQAFRLVKSGGFCVFFYDLDHHEKLQAIATEIGWKVQAWPFIACKTSSCRNQAPQYNTTKNYEVAMFLRRDEKTVLRKPVPSSWVPYDFAAERRLYNNPFAKPFALWKDIFDAIAFPGQRVADLCIGEMSSARAMVNCGLIPYGCELKEQHFNRGLEHMRAVYALVHKSNVQFT